MHPFSALNGFYTALVKGDLVKIQEWSNRLGINTKFSKGLVILFLFEFTVQQLPVICITCAGHKNVSEDRACCCLSLIMLCANLVCSAITTQNQLMTDGQTQPHSIYHARIALHSKN